jgi:hypothetical protein
MKSSIRPQLFLILQVQPNVDEAIPGIKTQKEVSQHDSVSTGIGRKIPQCATSSIIALRMEEIAFPKTTLALAPPIESMQQGFLGLGFILRDVRFLFKHSEFPGIPFKSNQ